MSDNSFIRINKSSCISGTVTVEGAKNSILPITPCAILANGISKLNHVPYTYDVKAMIALMSEYKVNFEYNELEKSLEIDTSKIINKLPSKELFSAYRASAIVSGAIFARFKEAWISSPGGDKIGKRPINIHLDVFRSFGAKIDEEDGYIHVYSEAELTPGNIFLEYPSVGATQNALIVAASIEGRTVIDNVAQEPEILDMIEVLVSMGAKIDLKFQSRIIVYGSKNLKPYDHTVIPDRLEAGTLLIAAAITGGSIDIPNAPAYSMYNLIDKLIEMGHKIEVGQHDYGIKFYACENPKTVSFKTMPYPGFSTDFQSPMTALLAVTLGNSKVHETVFESRMAHVYELNKMGAKIEVEYDCAKITGVEKLKGAVVTSGDIRSCAALILAGLAAEGETIVYGTTHLNRGYYKLIDKLASLGAEIEIVNKD